jgi:hypothetical protein
MKARFLLVLFLLLPGSMNVARAGANLAETGRPVPFFTENDANSDATARDEQSAGKVLRCWQHGRLLFESSGFTQMTGSSSSVVVSRQDGEPMTVFNFQDGLCTLSDR